MRKVMTTILSLALATVFVWTVRAEGNDTETTNTTFNISGIPEYILTSDTPRNILKNVEIKVGDTKVEHEDNSYDYSSFSVLYPSSDIVFPDNDYERPKCDQFQLRVEICELKHDDDYDYEDSLEADAKFEEGKTYNITIQVLMNSGGENKIDLIVNGEEFKDKTIGKGCPTPASLDWEEKTDEESPNCMFTIKTTYTALATAPTPVPTPTPSVTPEPTTTPEPTVVPTPTPTATPSSAFTTTKTSGYDDGSPYTYDDCGSVYDRWGNMIYEGHSCTTYSLVRTSVID